jgi:hypothetical protein
MDRIVPSAELIGAARDYLFLLNRGYPEKPSIELVGNRYRLDGTERIMLFRGICSESSACARRAKRAALTAGQTLYIDGYNLFLTLFNYRTGKRLFVGYDGFLRDAGGTRGRLTNQELFKGIIHETLVFLGERGAGTIRVYLDSPVPHSAEHAGTVRGIMEMLGMPGSCELCESADYRVKRALDESGDGTDVWDKEAPDSGQTVTARGVSAERNPAGCIAVSSDTAVIDAFPGKLYDCARDFLEIRYAAEFCDFMRILE